jgi:hypothetical protein
VAGRVELVETGRQERYTGFYSRRDEGVGERVDSVLHDEDVIG